MPNFKVVLTVISTDSVSPYPIGPRFRRGLPMPMENLYQERGGYYFDPDTELDLAKNLAESFARYVNDHNAKKTKKK
jgi:hypothetical protein